MDKQCISPKVCFMNFTEFWGGGEKWHYETGAHMMSKGHQVFYAVRSNGKLHQRVKELPVQCIDFKTSMLSFLNPFKVLRLRRFLKKNEIKVVVLNSSVEMKLGGLAAFLAGVPDIIYRRGIAKKVKPSFINKLFFKHVITGFLANSEESKRKLTANFNDSIYGKEVRVIYNGIQAFEVSDTQDLGVMENTEPETVLTLGNAARLSSEKGQELLLQMAAQLKADGRKFRLLLAGEGPAREALEMQVKAFGLEKEITFLGHVNNIPAFMRSLDVFVFSSKEEGFGFAIAEAMLAEKPVVAFEVGGIPEVVEPGETGFLVKPFDIDSFTHRVVALADSSQLRNKMGQAGRQRVLKYFDKYVQLEKISQFIVEKVKS